MEKKLLVLSVVGALVFIVLGGAVWYYMKQAAVEVNSQPTMTTGPTGSGSTLESSLATSKEILAESSTGAAIDDITKSISDDLKSDESALFDEETDETSAVTESGNLMRNLGQTYDESQY